MIELKTGDLFAEDADALVNAVNCIGVMGGGIAAQFKKRFPENCTAYEKACESGELRLGRVFVYETGAQAGPKFIVNFPTLHAPGDASRLEDVEAGLADLERVIRERGIRSIAIPGLGCGAGGLDWEDVRARIEAALGGLDGVRVALFAPMGA